MKVAYKHVRLALESRLAMDMVSQTLQEEMTTDIAKKQLHDMEVGETEEHTERQNIGDDNDYNEIEGLFPIGLKSSLFFITDESVSGPPKHIGIQDTSPDLVKLYNLESSKWDPINKVYRVLVVKQIAESWFQFFIIWLLYELLQEEVDQKWAGTLTEVSEKVLITELIILTHILCTRSGRRSFSNVRKHLFAVMRTEISAKI